MNTRVIVVAFYCICLKFNHVALALFSCPKNQYRHLDKLCCDNCPPGSFVKEHCNRQKRQTVCEECKAGSFSSDWTSSEECSLCRNPVCQPTMSLTQTCNSTVDNECGCLDPHRFHHIATDSCRDCVKCLAGHYPFKPCTGETICVPCPDNYFSNITNNYNKKCTECRKCNIYKTSCSSRQDAVCGRNVYTTTETPPTSFQAKTVTTTEESSSTRSSSSEERNNMGTNIMITLFCLLAVTLVTVIIALIYYKKKKVTNKSGTGFEIIEESRRRMFSFGGLLLRDQPATIILGLHSLLNPETPNNWKILAGELGFAYIRILNYEANRETAAEEMLRSWSTSDSSTLDRLWEALGNIGRDDVCDFLERNVEFQSEETIV